jgi:hypothetical protein
MNTKEKKKKIIDLPNSKKVALDKYFGKAPVFGDGVKYQRKLRDN